MPKKPRRNFWTDGFSIDETRVSTLIVLLYVFSGLAIYSTIKTSDIPSNLVSVIIGLVTAIAGINIADKFANRTSGGMLETYDRDVRSDDSEPPI